MFFFFQNLSYLVNNAKIFAPTGNQLKAMDSPWRGQHFDTIFVPQSFNIHAYAGKKCHFDSLRYHIFM